MSTRTLLIWIIIAGALGAGVILLKSNQDRQAFVKPQSSTRTIGFDPAMTVGLERLMNGQRQFLELDTQQINQWLLHWVQGDEDSTWDVDSMKARSGIRALATARVTLSDTDQVTIPGGELTVHQKDGHTVQIVFDESSSGGMCAVRIEERNPDGVADRRWFGRVDRGLYDSLVRDGMLSWRSTKLFDLANSAVQQVHLEAGGSKVELIRDASGWNIQYPFSIHGNTERIEELTKTLITLQAESFVDENVSPETSGISNPIATLSLGTQSESSTLRIGTRADVNGSTVYASLETPSGMTLITLQTDQLSKLTASVPPYVSMIPTNISASNIQAVRINGKDNRARLQADRELGKWMIQDKEADSFHRDAVDRLVQVLTRSPAPIVRVFEDHEVPGPLGSIDLIGIDGSVLGHISVALDSTESGMRLLMMQTVTLEDQSTKTVLWAADGDDAAATGAWLTAVAGKRVP